MKIKSIQYNIVMNFIRVIFGILFPLNCNAIYKLKIWS